MARTRHLTKSVQLESSLEAVVQFGQVARQTPGANAYGLQCRIRTLPVNAGTFHREFVRSERGNPLRQSPTIPFERTETPLLDARAATGFFGPRTSHDLRLMNVEANNTLIQRHQFNTAYCQFALEGGR